MSPETSQETYLSLPELASSGKNQRSDAFHLLSLSRRNNRDIKKDLICDFSCPTGWTP